MSKKANSGSFVFLNTPEGVRFVGKFDELYENIKDPWGQIEDDYYHQRRLGIINSISKLHPTSILDVGCGFGHTTQALKILVCKDVTGVDISKVAVNKAKKLFPDVKFKQCDVRKVLPNKNVDMVVLDGILWYILDDLDSIIENIYNHLNCFGHLVIAQAFIQDQKYGVDIINGYEGLIKYLHKHNIFFKLVETSYHDTGTRKTDSITILQKRS